MKRFLGLADGVVRAWTRHRLDSTNSRGDAGLVNDLEQADQRRVADVRSAAELHRYALHIDDSDHVTVLLTEERHCTLGPRVRIRHLRERDRGAREHFSIDDRFDFLESCWRYRTMMRE